MVSDAVVTRAHRELAARSAQWSKATCTKNRAWFESGIKTTVGCFELERHAQSLANLEATVRREYAGLEAYRECCTGLVFVAIHVRDLEEAPRWLRAKAVMELDKVRLVDTEQFELNAELEKLNDGK